MFIKRPLIRQNIGLILENVKQAKQYVQSQKLSQEDLNTLIEIDPSPTRKYVGWMAKIWMTEHPDIDDLKSVISEFNTFLEKGKAKTKDINQFKSFKDLKSEVEELNNTGAGMSQKDLESDYETIIDNNDLLIMTPHTHEASRKLGLTHFAFRKCEGGKDSAWCTTYKSPDHFNSYYYKNNVTFYYIKVKSTQMIEELKIAFPKKWESMVVTALALLPNGKIDGYDGKDKQIKPQDVKTFTNIIGIS